MTISKEVVRLAFPSILANITIPLVGMVDLAIVGHLSNISAIGGIAIGTMLFDLLYWNFGFLRVGTGGTTAQAYGRKDNVCLIQTLVQGIGIAFAAALAIWLIQWIFFDMVMYFVPHSKQVGMFASQYFFIRIWAAPATLALMAFKGWFIGMQDTVSPMLCDIVVNVVNMVASYGLAVLTPLGFIGVAYGTIIAQYVGLLLAFSLLIGRYRYLFPFLCIKESFRWLKIKSLFVLNHQLFQRSLCFMVIYVGFTALTSKYGSSDLAVGAIMMKLFMLFSYFVDGFAYAGEALVGRFIGEQNGDGLRQSIKISFLWVLCIGVGFTLLFGFIGDGMVRMMSDNAAVLSVCRPFLPWLVVMPIISSAAFMWDGIYVGATAGIHIRNCMFFSAVCFVVSYILLAPTLKIQAVYVAYFIHLLVRTVYLSFYWPKTNPLSSSAGH